jgi:hypothetical protein
MGAKELKARQRKEIELSDGTKIIVKKLSPYEWTETGIVPDILFEPGTTDEKRKATLEDKKSLKAMFKVAFLRGVIPQADFIPVDKPSEQCTENEITFQDIDEIDLTKILTGALFGGAGVPATFSGIEKTVEGAGNDSGHDGPPIP